MNTFWTPDKIELLRLLVEKKLTASEIAAEMGASRNAVIGACRRKGISLYFGREARRTRSNPPFWPIFKISSPTRPDGPGVHLRDLEYDSCRWPLWDDKEKPTMMFCGERSRDDAVSYCDEHCLRAHAGTPARSSTYVPHFRRRLR